MKSRQPQPEFDLLDAIEVIARAMEAAPTGPAAAKILRREIDHLVEAEARAVEPEYRSGEAHGRVHGRKLGFERGRDWPAVRREKVQVAFTLIVAIALVTYILFRYFSR